MNMLAKIVDFFMNLINTLIGFAKTIFGSKYLIFLVILLILGRTGLFKLNLGVKRGKH